MGNNPLVHLHSSPHSSHFDPQPPARGRLMVRTAAYVTALLLCLSTGMARPQRRDPDVNYVPTPLEVVDAMLKLAEVKSTDIVYDLGSGDGRILIAAAQRYGARGVGIEIDPALVKEATAKAQAAGVGDKVRFVTGDLFTADIREATVVTLYLLETLNEKLRPKLLRELKPGTRIVSHRFRMGDWIPEQAVRVGDRAAYLWRIPAR